MRFLYSCLFYFILPILLLRLLWRSRKLPIYRRGISQRLGYYPFQLETCIWVHAVSVGEVIAALPLIRELQNTYPSHPILVTTITPTGKERVQAAFGERVHHVYLPYDIPSAVKNFLSAMHPRIAIIMETELWPNLLAYSHQKRIPICLVNARLSSRSASRYKRVFSLTRDMLSHIECIAAQSEKDAQYFLELGAELHRVVITGNMKFDLTCPPDLPQASQLLREKLGQDRFVWIAASTHPGEEELILSAHQQLRLTHPDALLILVPRHPDRFEEIAKSCERLFVTSRHSQRHFIPNTAVYLGDTMGELLLFYGASDAAFVGGSLVEQGGHNLLEPALLSKPILSGPYLFNFLEISQLFLSTQSMMIVHTVDQLVNQLIFLIKNPNEAIIRGQCAYHQLANNGGALQKNMLIIKRLILL